MFVNTLSDLGREGEVRVAKEVLELIDRDVNRERVKELQEKLGVLKDYNVYLAQAIREGVLDLYGGYMEEVPDVEVPPLNDGLDDLPVVKLLSRDRCSNELVWVLMNTMDYLSSLRGEDITEEARLAGTNLLEALRDLLDPSMDGLVLMLTMILVGSLECDLGVGKGGMTIEELIEEPFSNYVEVYSLATLIAIKVDINGESIISKQGLEELVGKLLSKLGDQEISMTPLQRLDLARLSQYWLEGQPLAQE